MNRYVFILFICLTISFVSCEDDDEISDVKLGQQTSHTLTEEHKLKGRYRIQIAEDDLPEDKDKWFVFVLAEPSADSQLIGSPQKISIKSQSKDGKTKQIAECKIRQEMDSCFVKNKDFNYKTQKLLVEVKCSQDCDFNFMTQVDSSYKLKPNRTLFLDFENTAYSKIFTLQTKGLEFNELRIILKPQNFLSYPEPIQMLANFGNKIPTRKDFDLKGIHLWDDGQGIFLHKGRMKDDTLLTILVEGPQNNKLQLTNQLKKQQQSHELDQVLPYFDFIGRKEVRKYTMQLDAGDKQVPFFIRIQTFSGSVECQKLYRLTNDKKEQIPIADPIERYGLFEFRLSPAFIRKHGLKKLQMVVKGNKRSTFVISYYPAIDKASNLMPMLSKSSYMEQKQIDQYLMTIREIVDVNEDSRNFSKIEVIVGNIKGKVNVNFYTCTKKQTKYCYIGQSNKGGDKQIAKKLAKFVKTTKSEKRFWFTLDWTEFKKDSPTSDEGSFRLLAVVENIGDGSSQYEIQYKNKDRIHILKQKQLVYDRIDIDEKRLYKYSNSDDDIEQIRVHVSMISGKIEFYGFYEDPRTLGDDQALEEIFPNKKILYFEKKKGSLQDIFVKVHGIENAYYSISLQLIRNSEKQIEDDKEDHTGYNELIIKERVQYEYIISPKQKMIFQLHPSQMQFIVHLTATLPLQICMTQKLQLPPFKPNCEVLVRNISKMDDAVVMDKSKIANFGVINNNKNNVTFKISISSKQALCYDAQLGIVMTKQIEQDGKDKDGTTTHCLSYYLNKFEDIQVIVSFSNHKYRNGSIQININEERVKMTSPTRKFDKDQLEAACKKNVHEEESFCILEVLIQNISNTQVTVVVQYIDDQIKLVDGIAHTSTGMMKKNQPKKFLFWIQNAVNTTVYLQNVIGQYILYGKYMTHLQYLMQKRDNPSKLFPTEKQNSFMSTNPFFYLQQIYVIGAEELNKKCMSNNEGDCLLLLSAFLKGEDQIKANGKFNIQVTQQNRVLKKNEPVASYLEKQSVAYYQFQNRESNGTLVVNINNQNKRCLNIMIKEGDKRATSGGYDKRQNAANQLVLENTKKSIYSITLHAIEHCPYVIEVNSNKNQISTIKKGKFTDIDLKIDQQFNLVFQNLIDQSFKVLSIHKSGQVMISVKPIQRQQLDDEIQKNIHEIKDWKWTGVDQVRIDNVDKSGKRAKNYCVDCFYLIHLSAKRKTQASILIPTPGVQIPINTDVMIKDLLIEKEEIVYRIFTATSAQFQIYLQYGQVNLTIVDSDSQKAVYTKKFTAKKQKPILEDFNLTKNEEYDYKKFSRVTITALKDTLFSFGVVSNSDKEKRGEFLKFGIPTYLYFDSDKQKCVKGVVESSGDKFLVSFSGNDKKIAEKVNITFKVSGTIKTLEKQMGANEMVLSLSKMNDLKASSNYELCLKTPKGLSVTLIQSSPIIYFPEKQRIFVKNQINLTFGSTGSNYLQINQCAERAITYISEQFNSLQSLTSQIKQNRKNNHIITFYHFGPLFINSKMTKGTVKWSTYDERQGNGMGYFDYQPGWLRFRKQNNSIVVQAQPISKVSSRANSQIQKITYSFHTGKQENEMNNAMNCGDYKNPSKEVNKVDSFNQRVMVSFDIKNDLNTTFWQYSYFLVGMKAQIQVKNKKGQIQNYRFYYPYQQVQKQLLKEGTDTPVDPVDPNSQQETSYFYYILFFALVIVFGFFLYRRSQRRKRTDYKNAGMELFSDTR